MSYDLKSCPFCGGEAVTASVVISWLSDEPLAQVRCKECGVANTGLMDSMDEAVAAWNRRHERTCVLDDFDCVGCVTCLECGGIMSTCSDEAPVSPIIYCSHCGARVVRDGN